MFWLCNNLASEKLIILFKTFPKMDHYQPISCDFYDELAARATLRRSCHIEFRDASGQVQTTEAVIKDLYSRSKVEYMLLSTGLEIRLDHLISVDGKPLPEAC